MNRRDFLRTSGALIVGFGATGASVEQGVERNGLRQDPLGDGVPHEFVQHRAVRPDPVGQRIVASDVEHALVHEVRRRGLGDVR